MTLTPTAYLEKKTAQIFVCDIWTCDEFSLASLDGVPYILATGKMRWPINPKHLIVKDTRILLSLLDLHGNLTPTKNLRQRNIANYEKECPATDVEKLCQWCEKHGSPFASSKTGNMLGIRLGTFRMKLNELYEAYETWQKIAYNANKTKKETEQLQDGLNLLNRCPLSTHVDFSLDIPRLFFRCRTMFDLAHTQLSFMAASQLEGSIALCDRCHTLFEKTHGNKKLCSFCSKTRYQASREKARRERGKHVEKAPKQ